MKSQIVEKLQKAQVFTEPFKHVIIKNLLPEDVFKELEFVVKNTNSGVKENVAMDHQTIIDTRDTTEYPDFWYNWYNVFEDNQVWEILKQKFDMSRDFTYLRCDIHKCEPGFQLGRHNDIKKGIDDIVSLQIYITENDKDNGVVLDNIKHIENKPNTAWSFACGEDTWHSVPKVTKTRHSLLMKYCIQ